MNINRNSEQKNAGSPPPVQSKFGIASAGRVLENETKTKKVFPQKRSIRKDSGVWAKPTRIGLACPVLDARSGRDKGRRVVTRGS